MDPQSIEQQDIAARYLSGDLTIREAREFENYCLRHPQILETLPIPVRLKARLARRRLLEDETEQAAGAPPPVEPVSRPAEPSHTETGLLLDADEPPGRHGFTVDRPAILYSLLAVLLIAAGAIAMLIGRNGELADRVGLLERTARSMALRAPSSLQAMRIVPDPIGPPLDAQVAMRWPDPPQLLELSIDVSEGRYTAFAVTVDKVDEARIMQIRRITPDSNRELRIGLNTSAFGPGTYDFQIQGYTWRGDLTDYGWVRIQLIQ
jgi:hypothetical protein